MLTVVGGSYYERCFTPSWHQLYGSGLRAVVAVRDLLCSQVQLHTWIAPADQEDLALVASSYHVKVIAHERESRIEFTYDSPVSPPVIWPDPRLLRPKASELISADEALVFGMLECQPVVHAKRLVYDPQSGPLTVPFSKTRCHAERLAIVMNFGEATAYARAAGLERRKGAPSPEELARRILKGEDAEAVVIKCGALGACVASPNHTKWIGSFETESVFPVGSGDVFSAVFAAEWGVRRRDPVAAATLASRGTALYCQTTSLPLPLRPKLLRMLPRKELRAGIKQGRAARRVYLAGPFFTVSQRWLVETVRNALADAGLDVFSPLHDVGLCAKDADTGRIAHADLKGLEHSDIVFAILDGMDPGTIFEVGYAVARQKPVVALYDNRGGKDVAMFVGTGCELFGDLTTAVYKTSWRLRTM